VQSGFKKVNVAARKPESVRAKYDADWSVVRVCVDRVLARRPRTLAHGLRLLQRELAVVLPRKSRFLRLRPLGAVMTGQPLPPLAEADLYPLMARQMVADIVAEACGDDTRRIVELGSGWGGNLFHLRSGGAPPAAEFHAMEFTETGRQVTRMLATLDPEMKLLIHPFDYHRPDFSPLAAPLPTVVFSNHSIEQVTELGRGFFDALLAVPGLQRVVHIDPVGCQLGDSGAASALAGLLSQILPPTISWRADFRRRARRHAYNIDLVPLLRALEREQRIAIERILPDHIGANPLNPATIIVWHPRTQ
jgi:hypothetical protein